MATTPGIPSTPPQVRANQIMQNMARALDETRGKMERLELEAQTKISALENSLAVLAHSSGSSSAPKINKPPTFSGKSNIDSWVTHVRNYLEGTSDEKAIPIALSYISGAAHEWYLAQKRNGLEFNTLEDLFEYLKKRFTTVNKEKLARDKLSKWKQFKDVQQYNEDFLKIVLDIPNISMEEQLDRYTRGLRSYIWKELCTNEYKSLTEAMKDAERVESAFRRGGQVRSGRQVSGPGSFQGPVPMDIGNVKLKKLTKEEREHCRKLGLCFRCRQSGHMARDPRCPKNSQRN